jgi:hypothetical protein
MQPHDPPASTTSVRRTSRTPQARHLAQQHSPMQNEGRRSISGHALNVPSMPSYLVTHAVGVEP